MVYDLVPWECCLNKGSVVCKGFGGQGCIVLALEGYTSARPDLHVHSDKGRSRTEAVRGLNVQNVVLSRTMMFQVDKLFLYSIC